MKAVAVVPGSREVVLIEQEPPATPWKRIATSWSGRRRGSRTSSASHSHAEWLEADGLGGFASGTVSGIRTRRYHAILLAATSPPAGRVVLVNGFEAWLETPGGAFPLTSQRYTPDVVHPHGAHRIVPGRGARLARPS